MFCTLTDGLHEGALYGVCISSSSTNLAIGTKVVCVFVCVCKLNMMYPSRFNNQLELINNILSPGFIQAPVYDF